VVILLIALVVLAGVAGYFLYTYTQTINTLQVSLADAGARLSDSEARLAEAEGRLTDADATITNLEEQLTATRGELSRAKSELESVRKDLTKAQQAIPKTSKNPTRADLVAFLEKDDTDEQVSNPRLESDVQLYEATFTLKENLQAAYLRAAIALVEYDYGITGGRSHVILTPMLCADLEGEGRVYFSPMNDKLYASPEELLGDSWLISDIRITKTTLHWG